MRSARGLWSGWVWLLLCHCTADHAPAAVSGGAAQRADAATAALSDAEARGAAADSSNVAAPHGHEAAAVSSNPAIRADAGPRSSRAQPMATADSDAGDPSAADSGAPHPEPEDTSCLEASGDLDKQGRFAFEAKSVQSLKLWLPKLPAGCKTPVVHLANGTGATCSNYQPVLERLASHGFLSVCAENTNTGSGLRGMEALEAVLEMYPELAAHKIGSTGHEAGGQGAILSLQQLESKWGARAIYAGMAIAPASGHGSQPPGGTWEDSYANLRSPMLMMSGTQDALVSERRVADAYQLLNDNIEAYWYSGVGALHIPVPNDYIQELAIAWFRWKLLGDAQACEYFKRLPDSERWDLRAEQNAEACR